jgi:CBS domain-containing protein
VNEIEGFLRTHPPFDDLPPEELAAVAGAVQVEFFLRGSVLLRELGEPAEHLYVVRTGSVEQVRGGQVVDVLEPGELFGHPSLVSASAPLTTVRAAEDSLCYLIPRDVAEHVLGTPSGLAFLARSLRRRLDHLTQQRIGEGADPRLVRVEDLVRRPPLVCRPEATVREAAELMARERSSSVLVPVDGGFGIVTDRDLRTKVVAQGLAGGRPVRDVMSHPARSIPGDTLVDTALLEMLDRGIHHLPIVDARGSPVGVLTDTDVLGLERRRPFILRTEIERATTPDEVSRVGRALPESIAVLVRAGVDPVDIGHIVALTVDAMTVRLLELASKKLGVPPIRWAWLALGSEARREQALSTDQDHALVLEDGADREADEYFHSLAEAVVVGLESSGIPRCRAGVIASERAWRRSRSSWLETFDRWMSERGLEPVTLTTIGFDYRAISGTLDAEPALNETVRSARDRPVFLRRLARAALDFRPPVGFRGAFVVLKEGEHAGMLDLKQRGLLPVVDLARLFALEGGLEAKTTLDRLRTAEESGVIGHDVRAGLEESYRVILDSRVEHQARQVESGTAPDNFIDPETLGAIDRARLKDAFRAISHVQRDVARRFGIARLP